MKNVVVLGSTGMAGHMISYYLEEAGFQVFRVSRSEKNTENSRSIDVVNIKELLQYIDEVRADVVINCIGLLQKACEERPDMAVLINSYLPHCLEKHYENTKVKIIHLSTDCVFSGERGNYKENEIQDGRTFYDRSKALGEICNKKDITFRMSIIGPDIDINGTGLLNWFMKQSGAINGYSKAFWNGITTLELAKAIEKSMNENLTGLYQLVPSKGIDKYNLLILFNEILKKKKVNIVPKDTVVVNKCLINTRNDFSFQVKDYPEQIKELKDWIENHKNLYPEYYYTM